MQYKMNGNQIAVPVTLLHVSHDIKNPENGKTIAPKNEDCFDNLRLCRKRYIKNAPRIEIRMICEVHPTLNGNTMKSKLNN